MRALVHLALGSTLGAGLFAACAESGRPCQWNAPCDPGYVCLYRTSDGCGATGFCETVGSGAACTTVDLYCACDGTSAELGCRGLPGGYATKPVAQPQTNYAASVCLADGGVAVFTGCPSKCDEGDGGAGAGCAGFAKACSCPFSSAVDTPPPACVQGNGTGTSLLYCCDPIP